jgi:hypothetical protein
MARMKVLTATIEHTPRRPAWDCESCGAEWPCEPAKVELGQAYGEHRTHLAVYMAVQLGHAAGELTTATTTQLYERFIAWTRP